MFIDSTPHSDCEIEENIESEKVPNLKFIDKFPKSQDSSFISKKKPRFDDNQHQIEFDSKGI